MKLGLRFRLFLLSLAAIVAAVVVADVTLTSALDHWLAERVRADLEVRLRLVERVVSRTTASADDLAGWDRVADDLGRRAAARVTIVRADGVVIGDSDVGLDRLPHLENHAGRPEVMAALAGRVGQSERRSTTLGERMLYLAGPFTRGATQGAVRVALPLTEVGAVGARLDRMILTGTGLGLVLAGLLSFLAAHVAARGARALTETARRMGAGDLDARTHADGRDELAELGRTLDRMAESLKTTLSQLRDERDLLTSVMEGMQEGVLVLGPKGRVELVNSALRAMLLIDGESRGRPLLEVARHADLKELVDRALADETAVSGEIDIEGIRPRHLVGHASPLAGRPGGVLAVLVDLTDVKRLESLRRDFVANVSHELRTPVAAVRAAAETLRGGAMADREAAGRFVDMIERNAERLERLVDDLLDLARIESREFRLQPDTVDLDGLFAQASEAHRVSAMARGIRLVVAISPGAGTLRADPRALEQIVGNLVDNAVKYATEGTAVTISADVEGDRLRIGVRDQGPGIDARHLPRLFERFYRVDPGRSRAQGGTGLGLSIVKHLCEAMGGSVSVDSRVGEGTAFFVVLPRA